MAWFTAALNAYQASESSGGGGGGAGGGGDGGASSVRSGASNQGIRFGVSENGHSRLIQTGIVMAGVVLVAIAVRKG